MIEVTKSFSVLKWLVDRRRNESKKRRSRCTRQSFVAISFLQTTTYSECTNEQNALSNVCSTLIETQRLPSDRLDKIKFLSFPLLKRKVFCCRWRNRVLSCIYEKKFRLVKTCALSLLFFTQKRASSRFHRLEVVD